MLPFMLVIVIAPYISWLRVNQFSSHHPQHFDPSCAFKSCVEQQGVVLWVPVSAGSSPNAASSIFRAGVCLTLSAR